MQMSCLNYVSERCHILCYSMLFVQQLWKTILSTKYVYTYLRCPQSISIRYENTLFDQNKARTLIKAHPQLLELIYSTFAS